MLNVVEEKTLRSIKIENKTYVQSSSSADIEIWKFLV